MTPTAARLPMLLLAAGLVAAALRVPHPPDARFLVPPAVTPGERPAPRPLYRLIDLPQPTPSAHASCLLPLHDGDLLVAWFGGAREGARDVAIHMARLRDGVVEENWVALTRERLQQLVHRVIRKLGNPVLWLDTAGRVHLQVASVSYGGWSGSAVNHLVSEDGGRTWSAGHRLILSPFFNLSTLVRTPPVMMEDGTIGFPCYHEFIEKWGLWTRITAEGRVLEQARMQRYEGGRLQPAVAATDPTHAVALLRSGSRHQRRVQRNATEDGGRSWPQRRALPIANPDSAVAMIRLEDGSLLLAANPLETGRDILQLFHSLDGGQSWTPLRIVSRSDEPGAEFSYPFLAQDGSGTIHLAYTHLRQGIRLCSFNLEWLYLENPPPKPVIEAPASSAGGGGAP
jgi:predicted neuraminidase